jgi:excisionase family DNA binding protein
MSQIEDRSPRSRMRSIREIAEFFGVSEKTVRRWIETGQLGAHRLGGQWRIAPEEVERFLATRSIWQRRVVR